MSWAAIKSSLQDTCLRAFGELDANGDPDPLYEPDGGTPFAIEGIFRDSHVGVDTSALEVQIATQGPTLDVKLADVVAGAGREPVREDRVVVGGQRYSFSVGEEDGEGMTKLRLLRT